MRYQELQCPLFHRNLTKSWHTGHSHSTRWLFLCIDPIGHRTLARKKRRHVLYGDKDWCDSGNIKMLSHSCSPDLELLTVKCRLHFLPREFILVIIIAVYILPQATTEAALSDLCKELNCSQTGCPDVLIVDEDFSHANLKKIMPNFHRLHHKGNKHTGARHSKKAWDWNHYRHSKYVNKLHCVPPCYVTQSRTRSRIQPSTSSWRSL